MRGLPGLRFNDSSIKVHLISTRRSLILIAVVCAGLAGAALAQVGPSAAEAAQYNGLLAAAQRRDLAGAARLLRDGAATTTRDRHGRTPLHLAVFAGQPAMVELLAAAGADLDALDHDRYDAVTIAAVADDEATLRVLLRLGASARNITSRWDGTALIAAAHLGHHGAVRQLIAANAPLDHINNLHWTAVIESIVLGRGGPRHVATLQALVAAGADLRITDREGRTPLALARAAGHADMVRLLESAGGR